MHKDCSSISWSLYLIPSKLLYESVRMEEVIIELLLFPPIHALLCSTLLLYWPCHFYRASKVDSRDQGLESLSSFQQQGDLEMLNQMKDIQYMAESFSEIRTEVPSIAARPPDLWHYPPHYKALRVKPLCATGWWGGEKKSPGPPWLPLCLLSSQVRVRICCIYTFGSSKGILGVYQFHFPPPGERNYSNSS